MHTARLRRKRIRRALVGRRGKHWLRPQPWWPPGDGRPSPPPPLPPSPHRDPRLVLAGLQLGRRHEERVEHRDATTQHRDLELVLALEKIEELLERHLALEVEAIPQRPLGRVVLELRALDRFGEPEERQRQIDKAVFVRLDLAIPGDQLVQLERDLGPPVLSQRRPEAGTESARNIE